MFTKKKKILVKIETVFIVFVHVLETYRKENICVCNESFDLFLNCVTFDSINV